MDRNEYNWKQLLEGLLPEELCPVIEKDGYEQMGKMLWNPSMNRMELTLANGGWVGLNEDGTWQFDLAPFSD